MTRIKLISALIIAAALAGCGKENAAPVSPGSTPAAAAPTAVSLEAIQAGAQGFTVGSPMSVRTVYVFFDAQCPHCGQLWNAAKPLKSQAKFVWIPVRLLAEASETQGATILAAKDPIAVMDEHETSLLARKGGIAAASNIDAQRAIVKKNTELFNQFKFASVPAVVGKHAGSGVMVVKEGALPTAELAALLGLAPPAQ